MRQADIYIAKTKQKKQKKPLPNFKNTSQCKDFFADNPNLKAWKINLQICMLKNAFNAPEQKKVKMIVDCRLESSSPLFCLGYYSFFSVHYRGFMSWIPSVALDFAAG